VIRAGGRYTVLPDGECLAAIDGLLGEGHVYLEARKANGNGKRRNGWRNGAGAGANGRRR
jgi:hypothetical protein